MAVFGPPAPLLDLPLDVSVSFAPSNSRFSRKHKADIACAYMYKYGDQNGLAAMLAVKRLASVAPEVNLRNPLSTGNKAYKRGIHPDFETQERLHQKSKTDDISGPIKMD